MNANVELDLGQTEVEEVTLDQALAEEKQLEVEEDTKSNIVSMDDGSVIDFGSRKSKIVFDKTTNTIKVNFVSGKVLTCNVPTFQGLLAADAEFFYNTYIEGIITKIRSGMSFPKGKKQSDEEYALTQVEEVARQIEAIHALTTPESRRKPKEKTNTLSWVIKAWAIIKANSDFTTFGHWAQPVLDSLDGEVEASINDEILSVWDSFTPERHKEIAKHAGVKIQVLTLKLNAGLIEEDESVL